MGANPHIKWALTLNNVVLVLSAIAIKIKTNQYMKVIYMLPFQPRKRYSPMDLAFKAISEKRDPTGCFLVKWIDASIGNKFICINLSRKCKMYTSSEN